MPDVRPDPLDLHRRSHVVDVHAHPSNKTYLFNKKLEERHSAGTTLNPLAMRVDLPKLEEGGVNVLVNALYLPEKGLVDDCFVFRLIKLLGPSHWRRTVTGNPFDRLLELLQHFEAAVARTPSVNGVRLRIAKSRAAIDEIVGDGDIAVLHSVEGGHGLNGDAGNVQRLFDLGVCLLTLTHFYPNDIAQPVPGVPPSMRVLGCFTPPGNQHLGLTAVGRAAVEEMARLGMVVDLTHSTPAARDEALTIVGTRRPVVMTHVGVHHFQAAPMNPTDAEVHRIAETGGMIGVIFMNHWLRKSEEKTGLEFVVDTMLHIRDVGGIEAVGIGSDFDGFTDPPDDLTDHSLLPKLTAALLRAGFSSPDVERILGGNARRVLDEGWGK